MLRLILDLLDISKAEEGQLAPRRRDIAVTALLDEVADEHRALAASRQVTLEVTSEVDTVSADPGLLRRLLENLIENALRHAPAASAVRLQASLAGDAIELRVADAGSGVPTELRERIFDKFVQLEHQGQGVNQGGRGLGLTFCKMVAEAHGGTIRVEDGAPGAVFCIRLPSA